MAWGDSTNVTVNNLGSPLDDPSQAREEIYLALLELQTVCDGRGAADGVAPLNASSKINALYLPDTLTSSSTNPITLTPDTGRVVVNDVLNLNPLTTAELIALSANEGDIAYCSDGDGGSECIAVCTGDTDSNGTVWYRIALGTQISAS